MTLVGRFGPIEPERYGRRDPTHGQILTAPHSTPPAETPDSRGTVDTQLVVETAARIADEQGIDEVTLTRVAKELNISQPALYRHVEGYDDLIRSLGLEARRVLADVLTEAAVGVAGDDAVRAMGRAWRQLVIERPGVYAATDRYPCAGDPELEEAVDRVIDVLGLALAAYQLDAEDQVHVARTLRSAFHGFASLEAGDGHPRPHDLDDTYEHLIDLLIAGIRGHSV